MDDFNFSEHFRLTHFGNNLWRAYNKLTQEPASPVLRGKENVIGYVKLELKRQLDEEMDSMLGGNDDRLDVYDVDSLRRRLSTAVSRDGSEEKF